MVGEVLEELPYRRLAFRVIELALRDLMAPACGAADRESARVFLAGSPMLRHWCSVASLDPDRVAAYAATLRRGARPHLLLAVPARQANLPA